jgi:hypothetical protein
MEDRASSDSMQSLAIVDSNKFHDSSSLTVQSSHKICEIARGESTSTKKSSPFHIHD